MVNRQSGFHPHSRVRSICITKWTTAETDLLPAEIQSVVYAEVAWIESRPRYWLLSLRVSLVYSEPTAPPLGYNNFLSDYFQLKQLKFTPMLYSWNRKIIDKNVRVCRDVRNLGRFETEIMWLALYNIAGFKLCKLRDVTSISNKRLRNCITVIRIMWFV